jgi:hypothetical protein
MDDLECLAQDSDREDLFTAVTAREHQAVHQTFHDRALNFTEFFHLVAAGGVRHGHLRTLCGNCDIVFETNVVYLVNQGNT